MLVNELYKETKQNSDGVKPNEISSSSLLDGKDVQPGVSSFQRQSGFGLELDMVRLTGTVGRKGMTNYPSAYSIKSHYQCIASSCNKANFSCLSILSSYSTRRPALVEIYPNVYGRKICVYQTSFGRGMDVR